MAFDLGTARGRIELDSSDLNKAETSLRQAGRGLLLVGGAALAGFGAAVAASANFEKQLSHIQAVTGATSTEIDALRKQALQLGVDTAFGASQIAGAFVELSKAGLQVEDILKGAGDAVVQLAAAGDLPIARSAEIAVNAMQTFSLRAEDMVHVSDLLAGAANASTVEVDDLATSIQYAGSIASAVGVSLEDLSAALAILGNRGIRGSTAGTSLRRVLLNLSPATKPAKKAMEDLGIILKDGTNQFFDASGNAKDFGTIIDILAKQTSGLNAEQKKVQLTEIFGARAVASVLVLLQEGKKGFEDIQAQIAKVTALDVMEKRLDNVAGSFKRLKATIETFLITGGGPWQDTIKSFLDGLTAFIKSLSEAPPWVAKLVTSALLVIGVLSVLAGVFLLTAGNMLRAVRLAGELGGAFRILGTIVSAAWTALSGFVTALASTAAAPFILIGLAIIALGLLLFYLYKRFDGFREFIDGIWQGLQDVWDKILNFFAGLPKWFSSLFGKIEGIVKGILDWLGQNWDIILTIFTGPLGAIVLVIRRWGGTIAKFIGDIVLGIIEWFQKLPGRVLGILSGIGGAIVHELSQLPNQIAYILGFILGSALKWGAKLIVFLVRTGINIVESIARFFEALPGRIIGFLDFIWDNFWEWGSKLISRAIEIGSQVLENVVNFFQQLPGRVIGFLDLLWDKFWEWSTNLIARAIEVGQGVVEGIANWMSQLPERVIGFVQQIPGMIVDIVSDVWNAATDLGKSLWNGFTEGVGDLAHWVEDALENILNSIGHFVGRMWDKAWSIGKSLVDGFRGGLGIGSPSHLERDMWRIVDNVHQSAIDLGAQVGKVQHLDRRVLRSEVALAPGVVTPEPSRVAADVSAPSTSSVTSFHVDQVVAQDPMTVMRETERRARLNQLVGIGRPQ